MNVSFVAVLMFWLPKCANLSHTSCHWSTQSPVHPPHRPAASQCMDYVRPDSSRHSVDQCARLFVPVWRLLQAHPHTHFYTASIPSVTQCSGRNHCPSFDIARSNDRFVAEFVSRVNEIGLNVIEFTDRPGTCMIDVRSLDLISTSTQR